jgi:hypothetical protein
MPPATTDATRKPWLPLLPKTGRDGATESSINFQAFEHYIALPAGERSLRRTAQDLNKSEKLMERWSSKFDWRRRASAWDQHLAQIEAEAREKQAREKAELWERRREQQREEDYQLRQALTKKMNQMLALPSIQRIVDASGRTTTRPDKSVITAVPALVRASIDLGREIFPEGHGAPLNVPELDVFNFVSMETQGEHPHL